ncbi:MAG: hypothetical protein AAFS03_11330, partial [Pseudomonadota bacterium]
HETLQGHAGTVWSAAFSPDGTRIVTASSDNTARVWRRTDDGAWAHDTLQGHEDWVRSAAFAPDGTRIVTASGDSTARVWDARYLSGSGDWRNTQTMSRPVAICLERLSNSWAETADPAAGAAQRYHPDRVITQADADAYPAFRDRIGEDVCAPILNPPPWWRALIFWR